MKKKQSLLTHFERSNEYLLNVLFIVLKMDHQRLSWLTSAINFGKVSIKIGPMLLSICAYFMKDRMEFRNLVYTPTNVAYNVALLGGYNVALLRYLIGKKRCWKKFCQSKFLIRSQIFLSAVFYFILSPTYNRG